MKPATLKRKRAQVTRFVKPPPLGDDTIWLNKAIVWWQTVMRRNRSDMTQMLNTFWQKVPHTLSVYIFRQSVEALRKKSKHNPSMAIKTSLFEELDRIKDEEALPELEARVHRAKLYRSCKDTVAPGQQPWMDMQTRTMFKRCLMKLQGIPEPQTMRERMPSKPAHVPGTFSHMTLDRRHPYRNVTWMPFPVRTIVIFGAHPKYAGEFYVGHWYRPNAAFYTDILKEERFFGRLGGENVSLGYVHANKPYAKEESVVPETIDSFRMEMNFRRSFLGKEQKTPKFSAQAIQAAAEPLLKKYNLEHYRCTDDLDKVIQVLVTASSPGADDDTRQAQTSYMRGLLLHILSDGSRRKPTQPKRHATSPVAKTVRFKPLPPSRRKPLRMTAIEQARMLPHDQQPPVNSLSDLLSSMRLWQGVDFSTLCWACNATSPDNFKTMQEGVTRTFCSEACMHSQHLLMDED